MTPCTKREMSHKILAWTCEDCQHAGEVYVSRGALPEHYRSAVLKEHDRLSKNCPSPQIAVVDGKDTCVLRYSSDSNGQRRFDGVADIPAYPD